MEPSRCSWKTEKGKNRDEDASHNKNYSVQESAAHNSTRMTLKESVKTESEISNRMPEKCSSDKTAMKSCSESSAPELPKITLGQDGAKKPLLRACDVQKTNAVPSITEKTNDAKLKPVSKISVAISPNSALFADLKIKTGKISQSENYPENTSSAFARASSHSKLAKEETEIRGSINFNKNKVLTHSGSEVLSRVTSTAVFDSDRRSCQPCSAPHTSRSDASVRVLSSSPAMGPERKEQGLKYNQFRTSTSYSSKRRLSNHRKIDSPALTLSPDLLKPVRILPSVSSSEDSQPVESSKSSQNRMEIQDNQYEKLSGIPRLNPMTCKGILPKRKQTTRAVISLISNMAGANGRTFHKTRSGMPNSRRKTVIRITGEHNVLVAIDSLALGIPRQTTIVFMSKPLHF